LQGNSIHASHIVQNMTNFIMVLYPAYIEFVSDLYQDAAG